MKKNKKEIIRSGNVELFEKGNLDIIKEIFVTNYVVHAGDKNYKGHEFIKRWTKKLRSALPDIKIVKIEFLNQTKDIIVWQRTLRGTHKENFMGILSTNKKVKWVEMVISHFKGNKIIEEWVVSEILGELLSKMPKKNKDL